MMSLSLRPLRLLLLVSFFWASVAAGQATPPGLVRSIDAVLDDPAFANTWWAALVVDAETGEVLFERNAQKSFIPASNTKLYTTAAALDQLGPGYRYVTPLYLDGTLRNGVLEGHLIVRGSGDPVIGGRFNEGDLTEAFRAWADSLKAFGVTRITGDLIGDDDRFDDVPLGYGWSWDDEPYWYAAEVGALAFNDNSVDLRIESQDVGAPGLVSWAPHNTDYVQVINRTWTTPPGTDLEEGYARERGTNVLKLSSEVPAGRTDLESLSVHNPTLYFMHVLREVLLQEGIAVAGRPVDVDDLAIRPDYASPTLRLVATHTSPPLLDIVEVINKRSQNLYAEQVLRTLGVELPVAEPEDEDTKPGSAAMGAEAAMRTYVAAGIDTSRIQLVDGSGLSRHNLVTAEMTVQLLRYMQAHPHTPTRLAFRQSLPVGGVDGTLEYRFEPGNAARNNVRAKTGTVGNVSALAGYVTADNGRTLVFSLMANHFTVPTSDVRDAQDAVLDLLARSRP